MSENLDVKKYPSIPKDATIKLEIQGDYYISLKGIFNNFLMEGETKESIGLILENLATKKITSLKEHRLYLMYIMLAGIEFAAKEQELLEYRTIDEIAPTENQD